MFIFKTMYRGAERPGWPGQGQEESVQGDGGGSCVAVAEVSVQLREMGTC